MYQQNMFFQIGNPRAHNQLMCVNTGNKNFNVLAADTVPNNHFNGDSQCFPLHSYNDKGDRIDNITDWGLEQFKKHYSVIASRPSRTPKQSRFENVEKSKVASPDSVGIAMTKEDIFHYVYGVLHNPAYRKKYELNLKREFPRIPFYDDFWRWTEWGKKLMNLHLSYEKVKAYSLKRVESIIDGNEQQRDLAAKAKLKADKETGVIILDGFTELHGVPKEAWEYKLGNRSALEWVLDQYKESKPKDPTIREKFDTYKFADYKEQVIELLMKVCTVSVETMKVVREMENK
jgi:predicted helicase